MYVLSLSNSSLNSLGHNSFRMLKKIKITNLECSHMHWKSRSAGNLTFTDFTRCLILCVFFTLTPTSSQFLPSNRKSLKNSVDASTPELKQNISFISPLLLIKYPNLFEQTVRKPQDCFCVQQTVFWIILYPYPRATCITASGVVGHHS